MKGNKVSGKVEFPAYASFGGVGGVCLRLVGGKDKKTAIYHRDAGAWETRARFEEDGSLVFAEPGPKGPDWTEPIPGQACTEEEWREDNAGYV